MSTSTERTITGGNVTARATQREDGDWELVIEAMDERLRAKDDLRCYGKFSGVTICSDCAPVWQSSNNLFLRGSDRDRDRHRMFVPCGSILWVLPALEEFNATPVAELLKRAGVEEPKEPPRSADVEAGQWRVNGRCVMRIGHSGEEGYCFAWAPSCEGGRYLVSTAKEWPLATDEQITEAKRAVCEKWGIGPLDLPHPICDPAVVEEETEKFVRECGEKPSVKVPWQILADGTGPHAVVPGRVDNGDDEYGTLYPQGWVFETLPGRTIGTARPATPEEQDEFRTVLARNAGIGIQHVAPEIGRALEWGLRNRCEKSAVAFVLQYLGYGNVFIRDATGLHKDAVNNNADMVRDAIAAEGGV